MVNKSPWAFLARINCLGITIGLLFVFIKIKWLMFSWSFFFLILISYQWWRDIRRERTYEGFHSDKVSKGLYISIVFFIISEVFFFFSFFWGYFHRRLSINMELGFVWPPIDLISFNPYRIPLLNRVILLSSGVTVTWVHHGILEGDLNIIFYGFFFTLLLSFYFTFLQGLEYLESYFCLSDSIYGSIFFLATGFHGIHVIIGRIFILIRFLRCILGKVNILHHVGIELAIWYWHFVDLVWLFLFIFVYWWWF